MRCQHPQRPRRNGFTLLELLIVMAIITILMGLTLSGAFKVYSKANQVQNRAEIAQLDTAIQTFCTQYNVDYLPSTIKLNSKDPTSDQYLARIFRRYDKNKMYAWNGSAPTAVTLEGHECLVFFLGGIPKNGNPPSCQGFSTNPADPTDFTTTKDKIAPFFEFNASRLKVGPKGFLYYLDTYKKAPYAYFSPNGTSNGYNAGGDCPSIGSLGYSCGTVRPYYENSSTGRFFKANAWQIISAGENGVFGTGGVQWGPTNPIRKPNNAYDDMANFANSTFDRP